jgi:two-component system sensor histidine kinase KdpD
MPVSTVDMPLLRAWRGYLAALLAALACTLAGYAMQPRFDLVNIAMVYLLPVVGIALLASRGAAVFSAALSVLLFDLLFVPPAGVLTIDDLQYLLTFAVMLAVGLAVSSLRERARREEAGRIAEAVDAERERMRSTLLASISHDLRTPLAVMVGASSSLAAHGEQLPAAERSALALSVCRQAQAMAEQTEKVLQMTRFEMGGFELQRDWNSVAEIAGPVLQRLREALQRHRLLTDIPGDLPLLRVDAPLIAQVLGNLVENAARHTLPGTVIQLRARLIGQAVEVVVEDNGPGLPGDDPARLFDKFRSRREGAGGVGLGLAICRAIVSLHDGRIEAVSKPGGGCRFAFTLPVEAAPRLPAEQEGPAS